MSVYSELFRPPLKAPFKLPSKAPLEVPFEAPLKGPRQMWDLWESAAAAQYLEGAMSMHHGPCRFDAGLGKDTNLTV